MPFVHSEYCMNSYVTRTIITSVITICIINFCVNTNRVICIAVHISNFSLFPPNPDRNSSLLMPLYICFYEISYIILQPLSFCY